jgi:hypothetical protein
MKRALIALLLFVLQLFLLFRGALYFGKYYSPILLAAVSLALPLPYLARQHSIKHPIRYARAIKLGATAIAIAGLAYCAYLLHDGFLRLSQPGEYSDVLPQIKALYERFARGEQPYYSLPLSGYAPFPVYMPLHWLPIGLSIATGHDIRWTGFIFLSFTIVYYILTRVQTPGGLIAGLLPVAVLYLFIQYSDKDMYVTLETIVAAYYLLLATGLAGSLLPVTIAGIICCLLSRYTLVFWLPLFALLLWRYSPKKNSYLTWGIVATSILLLYVLPFLARDTSILKAGVGYHNHCAIDDWHGYGNPPISWTHESAVSFGALLKRILPGDAARQVSIVRVMQAVLMIGLIAVGFVYYKRQKGRINIYNYGVVTLYYALLLFYLFSPLTYRYYWISVLMLSAVLCGEVVDRGFIHGSANEQS